MLSSIPVPSSIPKLRALAVLALLPLLAACDQRHLRHSRSGAPGAGPARRVPVARTRAANSSAWCGPATRPISASGSPARSSTRIVNVGDRVRAGDVVARLDPQDLELQVESARGRARRRHLESRPDASDEERYANLKTRGYVAVADYDRKKAAKDEAEGRLERARARSISPAISSPMRSSRPTPTA